MKEIDSYLSEKGLRTRYTTVTNGTIMNDDIKTFIDKKFFNLTISLDGIKELNDTQRCGNIESVHDCVIETIQKLKPRSYPLSIKSITTKKTVDTLRDNVKYISSLDVNLVCFEPVHYLLPESEFYISDDDHAIYVKEMTNLCCENLREMAEGNNVAILSHIFDILRPIVTKTRKINMCPVGRESITITAEGDVYPCHMFIGVDEFKMGNVHDDDFPEKNFKRIREMFYNANIYSSSDCNVCWARFLCGGECHYFSYICNKNLTSPRNQRCLEMRLIIEAVLSEVAEVFQNELKTKNLLNALKSGANIFPQDSCECII